MIGCPSDQSAVAEKQPEARSSVKGKKKNGQCVSLHTSLRRFLALFSLVVFLLCVCMSVCVWCGVLFVCLCVGLSDEKETFNWCESWVSKPVAGPFYPVFFFSYNSACKIRWGTGQELGLWLWYGDLLPFRIRLPTNGAFWTAHMCAWYACGIISSYHVPYVLFCPYQALSVSHTVHNKSVVSVLPTDAVVGMVSFLIVSQHQHLFHWHLPVTVSQLQNWLVNSITDDIHTLPAFWLHFRTDTEQCFESNRWR